MTADLREYFEEYGRAHDVFDIKRIVSFFHCPMLTIRQGKVILLGTPAEILEFYSKLLDGYREMKLARAVISSFATRPVGPNGAIVDILWSPSRADGSVITRFHQVYNLVSVDGKWSIAVSTRVE